ncbi:HK97-gp10 family putative phage morphogenesis protein [Mesorhizobium sp. B2-4-8]|uniref:HK97-gp10 family putative phage morphogenesis protein n=1 Tax=Mesorhizobium sp. B2-4-8 TaxID=2589941 RepID=UPI0015E299D1|nr:HK97-gp10 family putative phage morphogenesis protein [Mesorhizobium sp. B2-4-8]
MARDNGLADFQRRLAAIPKAVRAGVQPALDASADELVTVQRALAPRDHGTLQASIKWATTGELSRQVTAGGETTTRPARDGQGEYDYALGQEFGTRQTPAQPFFYSGYRLVRKRIRSRIKRAISKSVRASYGK